MLVNPHVTRLDMFRHLDGVLDEFGDFPPKMFMSALVGIAMPVLAWDHCHNTIASQKNAVSCATTPNTTFDEFLAQHLYLGVQPMSPFVNQSHGVLPSPAHLQMFEDWGPLFKAIRGKQWLLTPNAVTVDSVNGGSRGHPTNGHSHSMNDGGVKRVVAAKANVFSVGGGLKVAVAVVAGGTTTTATVTLAPLCGVAWTDVTATALLPGVVAAVKVAFHPADEGEPQRITVPLARGAGLLVLQLPSQR